MKKSRKRPPSFTGLVIRAAGVVFSIALAVSYSTVAVSPQTSSIPLFFGLFYIPLLIITALLALLLVMAGSRIKWLAIAAIAPSVFFIGDFYRLPGNGETGNTQDHSISILSYNAGMFGSSSAGLSRKECAESISELIDRNGCEVACLQEVYLGKNENLHEIFKDYKYIHSHLFTLPSGNRFGNVTLSKYPFSGKGVISFDNSTNLSIYSDIAVNGEEIRIYNNHLESYNISFTSFIKKSTDRHKMTDEIMYMGDKLNKSTIKRAEQVKTILEHAENAGKKVLLCGDFNDTPMSYTYSRLSKGMKDTFKEAGKGFGATYSYLWPLLRIDYLLVPKESEVLSHDIIRTGLSDHYPIISKLNI